MNENGMCHTSHHGQKLGPIELCLETFFPFKEPEIKFQVPMHLILPFAVASPRTRKLYIVKPCVPHPDRQASCVESYERECDADEETKQLLILV
jgi:hypothetical protein